MNIDKKVWLLEDYAHKTWTLSLLLSQEAARAGMNGKGYAAVARESKMLAEKMQEIAAGIRFDGNEVEELRSMFSMAFMMKVLSVNTQIEVERMAHISMDYNIPKCMTVYVHEMNEICGKIIELTGGGNPQKPYVIPEIAKPSGSGFSGRFISFSVGGHLLIEKLGNIGEIGFRRNPDKNTDKLLLRGYELPLINCYDKLKLTNYNENPDGQIVMIICHGRKNVYQPYDAGSAYAVLIDGLDLNAIFYTPTGLAVPPAGEHAFADYSLECWDTVDGGQMVFTDWEKLL